VDAGAGDGAAGVDEVAVPVLESLDFATSLLSEGFDSLVDSDPPSELFGA